MTNDAVNDWFLPVAERSCTEGNLVRPLVHGAVYFAQLSACIKDSRSGDEIYFTDWRGDADQEMSTEGDTIGALLCAAVSRGVAVRGLLWRSHSDKVSFSAQQNQRLGSEINGRGGEVLLDQRVRRGGSHHQKMFVLRHPGRPEQDIAFVGGIDLCHSRRDDDQHAGDRQRQPMDARYGLTPPWHDATLEIKGPAVHDVLATFLERWNDPTPLDHNNPYRRLLQRKAGMPRHATPVPLPAVQPAARGEHQVQVLRTYAAKRPAFPFAIDGERTVARAYERAFARAQHLVYVEDQYLWSDIVADALARALRRSPGLQVIAVVPRLPDADGLVSGPPSRLGQIDAMDMLKRAGGDRFAVYDIGNDAGTPIYVHAKVCIVDDLWMTCGSDNFNLRSWTQDSEITCAIVDPRGRLAHDLRSSLWAEHLGISVSDPRLREITDAGKLWRDIAQARSGRIRSHQAQPVSRLQRLWARPLYRRIYDPDGRPRRLRGSRQF